MARQSDLEDAFEHWWSLLGDATPYKRQYKFHPTQNYAADFAFPDEMLLVEIEGGIWIRGAHSRGSGVMKDIKRQNAATKLGWAMLRIPGHHVNGSDVDANVATHIDDILTVLKLRRGFRQLTALPLLIIIPTPASFIAMGAGL